MKTLKTSGSATISLVKLAMNMTAVLSCLHSTNSVKVGQKCMFGPIFDEKESDFRKMSHKF